MNILLNDTSGYHSGCAQVVTILKKVYNIDIAYSTKQTTLNIHFNPEDIVIVNGEGSMHHNTGTAKHLIRHIIAASRIGCKVLLVNTVWDGMAPTYAQALQSCDKIFTREVLSQKELAKAGIEAQIFPDLSYFSVPKYEPMEWEDLREGTYFRKTNRHRPDLNLPRIEIMKESWSTVVNKLRHTGAVLTGRHHEMYAACVAKCRFVTRPGNSWKNEALALSAGVILPTTLEGAISGKYDEEYEKLWEYLDSFSLDQISI